MSTDFFSRQDRARKNTFRLICLFVFAIAVLIAVTYFVVIAIFGFQSLQKHEPPNYWNLPILVGVGLGVLTVVGGGSLYKVAELASGGKSVALLLGGREIPPTSKKFLEKRLRNIVEEMSIASGLPVPAVYLLPDEPGINAFAAGYAPGDAVVAVSQGSLDYLNRDELQGVVAHEFSHILNGDMRLNIRLMGLIHGILILSLIGRALMDVTGRRRSSGKSKDGRLQIFLIGLALYILGVVGIFLGQMIQAAISRQREYLADASAVQFTRNPDGIGGALKKIGGMVKGSTIEHAEAGEVSHMFFANALTGSFSQLWATHPPLEARIRAIDPHWDGQFPEVDRLNPDAEKRRDQLEPKKPPFGTGMPTLPGLPQVPVPVVLGFADSEPPPTGTAPDRIRQAIQEPYLARAVVGAMILDPDPAIFDKQRAILAEHIREQELAATLQVGIAVRELSEHERLKMVHRAMPALREMSPQQYRVFRDLVRLLVEADQQISLFEFCLQRVVIHHLDGAFGLRSTPRIRYRSIERLAPELSQVLGMLAWHGAADESAARTSYARGMSAVLPSHASVPMPEREAVNQQEFSVAIDRFLGAPRDVRRQLRQACLACIIADGQVIPHELVLLRAICSNLDVPMPDLSTT